MEIDVYENTPEIYEESPTLTSQADISFEGFNLTDKQKQFLISYVKWGTKMKACMDVRVSPLTVEKWIKDNPDFATAFNVLTDAVGDLLEDQALRMAVSGNAKMLQFLLRGYKPKKYGNKLEVGGPGGGPVAFTWADIARRVEDEDKGRSKELQGEEEETGV